MRRFLPGIALAFGAFTPAMAQDTPPESSASPTPDPLVDEAEKPADRVSVDVGAALVSKYISRGIGFAEEASLQPYVTVSLSLPGLEGGAISGAKMFVGNWNNVKLGHVEATEAGQLTRFYENDFYVGGAVTVNDRWSVSATYYRYGSLSDSFDGYNDLELIVGFDDSGLWSGTVPLDNFSLSPSLRMVQEAGRPGRPDALYVQPSLSPSFDVGHPDRPVHVTMPLVVGLADTYYDDAQGGHPTFGFFRTGVSVSGQPFPNSAENVRVSGGVDVWMLNDKVVNGLGDSEVVGRIGVNWSF
ncbi:TorF family putative porin [Novosphingobium malaysiense]|uniref:Autotransporter domain-containing protein n=1 Tax=Novosphingobium malaysiense TaxID=1348853 RepID=A0A0B1ZPM5_9SPHN|nr:hypothetical protein [Novosphingobium malaysiense]KHK91102.1 hypothetical protein LK12_09305 [Novosphingobium malaysiense]